MIGATVKDARGGFLVAWGSVKEPVWCHHPDATRYFVSVTKCRHPKGTLVLEGEGGIVAVYAPGKWHYAEKRCDK